jgi:hypothetical protein
MYAKRCLAPILLALAACAPGEKAGEAPAARANAPANAQGSDAIPGTSFAEILAAAPVDCADGSCPEGAGMVAEVQGSDYRGYQIGTCSGFLIAPNIVATTGNCAVGYSLRREGCPKYLAIKFPATSSRPAEVRRCKKWFEPLGNDERNYAFFEIEPTSRAHFETQRDGVPNFAGLGSRRSTRVMTERSAARCTAPTSRASWAQLWRKVTNRLGRRSVSLLGINRSEVTRVAPFSMWSRERSSGSLRPRGPPISKSIGRFAPKDPRPRTLCLATCLASRIRARVSLSGRKNAIRSGRLDSRL